MENIKSIKTLKKVKDTDYISSIREFDSNGNEVLFAEFSTDGSEINKNISLFDANNRILEESHFSDGELTEKLEYIRMDDGKVNSIKRTYMDGSVSLTQYSYNQAENSVHIVTIDEDGNLEREETIVTDEKGFIIENVVDDKIEETTIKTLNEYNSLGKVSLQKEYNSDGEIVSVADFTYDDKGNLILYVAKNADGQIVEESSASYDEQERVIKQAIKGNFISEYSYDDADNTVTEIRKFPSGQVFYQKTSAYDANGLIAEESAMGDYTKYEYEFYS